MKAETVRRYYKERRQPLLQRANICNSWRWVTCPISNCKKLRDLSSRDKRTEGRNKSNQTTKARRQPSFLSRESLTSSCRSKRIRGTPR